MARVGIFGGTFDPIHVGHLLCAEQARDIAKLDSVLFVPVADLAFPKKNRVLPAQERMHICELAVQDNPYFKVSDLDIARGGITYSVDTLSEVRSMVSADTELFFIIGSDAAAALPTWHDARKLARLATFIVIDRPEFSLSADQEAELTRIGFNILSIHTTTIDVSSTELRARVSQGRSIRYLCPQVVCDYIAEQKLYQKGSK